MKKGKGQKGDKEDKKRMLDMRKRKRGDKRESKKIIKWRNERGRLGKEGKGWEDEKREGVGRE